MILFPLASAALLSLYALTLVLLRAPLFRTRRYRPMVLNIALSLSPAVVLAATIAALLLMDAPGTVAALIAALGALVWLLLLPNAGYLITELNLSHRRPDEDVPLWYDIILGLTLAMSGVVNTLVNVLLAQTAYVIVSRPRDPRPLAHPDSWVMVGVVLLLVTLGMYLGRYLRVNSWDLAHPLAFARTLIAHVREPGRWRDVAGFCLSHTLFFAILYVVVATPMIDDMWGS